MNHTRAGCSPVAGDSFPDSWFLVPIQRTTVSLASGVQLCFFAATLHIILQWSNIKTAGVSRQVSGCKTSATLVLDPYALHRPYPVSSDHFLYSRKNSICRAYTARHSRAQSITLPCDQDWCLAHSLSPTSKRHATASLCNIISTCAVRIDPEYTIVGIANSARCISQGSPPGSLVID